MTTPAKSDPAILAGITLAVVAFAGSLTHVQATTDQHGQTGWLSWAIALMPELMVGLCAWRWTRGMADTRTWIVGGTAVGFTLAANLAQAEHTVWGWVVAGWPAWAAVSSMMLIGHGPRSAKATTGTVQVRRARARVATDDLAPLPTGPTTPPRALTSVPRRATSAAPRRGAATDVGWDTTDPAAWLEQVAARPDRTLDAWAALTGISKRTISRRLADARGPSAVNE